MKNYNKNERLKAIKAVLEKNFKVEQVASTFQCSKSTLYRWISEYKSIGKFEPAEGGSRPRSLNQDDEQCISKLVEEKKDITISELIEKTGKNVSIATMHRCLIRLGFTYKKNAKSR